LWVQEKRHRYARAVQRATTPQALTAEQHAACPSRDAAASPATPRARRLCGTTDTTRPASTAPKARKRIDCRL